MQINDTIKRIRNLKGWSQTKMADEIREKRTTYAEWEDKTMPSFDVVVKIAAVTGVSLMEFITALDDKLALSIILDGKPTQELPTLHSAESVDFLKGRLAGKDELLAEKEARRLDVNKENERLYGIIEKYLENMSTNLAKTKSVIEAGYSEMQAEHGVLMDAVDVLLKLPPGTTSDKAGIVEQAINKEVRKTDKKAGAGNQHSDDKR